jgi:hypothetical protein
MVLWFGRDANMMLLYENGGAKVALITAILLISMYYLDMYDSLVIRNRREIVVRMVQVLGFGTIGMAAIYYVYPRLGIDLWSFLTGLVLVLVLVLACRETFLRLTRSLQLFERVIILGNGRLADALAAEVQNRPELGVEFIGYIDCAAEHNGSNGLRYLGGYDILRELVRRERIRRIVVTMGERRGRLPLEPLLSLKADGVGIGATWVAAVFAWLLCLARDAAVQAHLFNRLFRGGAGSLAAHSSCRSAGDLAGLRQAHFFLPPPGWEGWQTVHAYQVPFDAYRGEWRGQA